MAQHPLTVEQFLMATPPASLGGAGSLTALLSAIGLVGKTLAHDLRIAGLRNMLGTTDETNVQGEAVKKLDQMANETFIEVLQRDG
ncbi:MAG TPA: class 1 fructose-bisphosphatase, partial [Nitrospira sp.]|nr:class 1 fructose-bisphosphatase [Nitrospira sp.]